MTKIATRPLRVMLRPLMVGLVLVALTPSAPAAGETVADREAQVREATAEVDALSAAAGRALEAYQGATRARSEAQLRELLQGEQLSDSRTTVRRSRDAVAKWARATYQNGGAVTEVTAWMTLLQGTSPGDLTRNLVALHGISGGTTDVLRQAQDQQRLVTTGIARAQAASAASMVAVRSAEQARARSDVLVEDQRVKLATLSALLAGARQADEEARRRQALARAEQLVADALMQATARAAGGLVPIGACQGGDLRAYANGMIDPGALCPLWGAPGHMLRADSAYALEGLSRAFAAEHGKPLCVTDSYRPLADQVHLYATKPGLAAQPGTSNHGWGVALDLCGGVQRFGSEQHQWLVRNGPQFGWFHPQWARAGGGKPEPWHWEFAG